MNKATTLQELLATGYTLKRIEEEVEGGLLLNQAPGVYAYPTMGRFTKQPIGASY